MGKNHDTGPTDLYFVEIPQDLDYDGLVDHFRGCVRAIDQRQAVCIFIKGQAGREGRRVYNDFKAQVQEQTDQFVLEAVMAVARHYTIMYTGNIEKYGQRLEGIMHREGLAIDLSDPKAVYRMLEARYRRMWGKDERALRNVCRSVSLAGECEPVGPQEEVIDTNQFSLARNP